MIDSQVHIMQNPGSDAGVFIQALRWFPRELRRRSLQPLRCGPWL